MNNFLWALNFLTIIPGRKKDQVVHSVTGSVSYWFPVVGLFIGLMLSLTSFFLGFIFPHTITCALIIIVYGILTGALHLDGLADSCDGIWGGREKEKRLEIMRDSSVGVFGVIGIVFCLGLRYLCLVGIEEKFAEGTIDACFNIKTAFCPPVLTLKTKYIVLLIMPLVGRWMQIFAAGLTIYARSGKGTGSFILEQTKRKHVIYTSLFSMLVLGIFFPLKGVYISIIIIIFTFFWIWYIKRKIGGMTGDTLGATNEMSELLFLMSLFVIYD